MSKKTCMIDGCNNPLFARKLCYYHYKIDCSKRYHENKKKKYFNYPKGNIINLPLIVYSLNWGVQVRF